MQSKNYNKVRMALGTMLLTCVGFCAQAQDNAKFSLTDTERTQVGPMLIWSGVAFGAAFVVLLVFKLRHDKKKAQEMKEKMKAAAPRTRSNTRSSSSRSRATTS